jgi:FlaA1/EpsC-like NDP-sugar epimerase
LSIAKEFHISTLFKNILDLSRFSKKALMILVDSLALLMSLIFSFSIRLGEWFWPNQELYLLIFIAPLFAIPIFAYFGLYSTIIRFFDLKSVWPILKAVTLYALIWAILGFMMALSVFPRSVVLINWLLALTVLVSSRMLANWILTSVLVQSKYKRFQNVVIYGAGSAGRQLSTALDQSNEFDTVAFLDDDFEIKDHIVNGLKVFSPNDLQKIIDVSDIHEVLLAIPSLTNIRRREIINFLEPFPVLVRSLPGVSELAQGKVKVNDLLEIDLIDLLGRDPVEPNNELLHTNIRNKVVMVTGSGGSIGSELCRQIVNLKPNKLVLYEISESALYQIDQELKAINIFDIKIYPVIGSVTDRNRIIKKCKFYSVQTIYHAAAYKHVPLVEFNKSQGVFNNTIGTMQLAQAAIDSNVETFVLISTDKAVRPTNYMGASKRAAEMVLQALAKLSHDTCFTMVRFGNVLDSSGSVIPLFKKQIKEGGPVTVTHSAIVRYFMTIPEAVELVIQAGAMAEGGEVFVLDMGKPIRIYDLAVKMIKLSGLEVLDENNPKGDIEIKYTGLRPGEKLYEELLVRGNFSLTENKLIMKAEEDMIEWDKLKPILKEIIQKKDYMDDEVLCDLLKIIVPEFGVK